VIDNLNTLYTELKPSTVCDGVGVFAIKDIPVGTDVFNSSRKDHLYSWKVITDDNVRNVISRLCHTNQYGFYISDHPVNIGMSYYVNHHDEPNLVYEQTRDTYYTIKNIAKGEELLVSYDQEEQDWLI
jgi:hypothetical protein